MEIQLLARLFTTLQFYLFSFLVFFFRLVSQGRPLGNISIDIIFFSSSGLKHAFD